MSKRFQGGVLGVGFNPLQAPNAPTGVTGTAGNQQVSVAFTAPTNVGGSAISSYAVLSSPGGFGASGASSPITVTGLTNGTAYTFQVTALNSYGPSPFSAASGSVTPIDPSYYMASYNPSASSAWYTSGGGADSSGNLFTSLYQSPTVNKYSFTGVLQWQKTSSSVTAFYGSCMDTSGNFYAVGPATNNRAYLAKFDTNGNAVLQRDFVLNVGETAYSKRVYVDASGNIYMTVIAYQSCVPYWFVVKMNSSGTLQWQKRFTTDEIIGVAADSSGNVYVAESYGGLGVAKFDSSGNMLWRKVVNNVNSYATNITVDSSGVPVVCGAFYSGSSYNAFVMKVNSDGTLAWSRLLAEATGSYQNTAWAVACDSSNSVYFTGAQSQNGTPALLLAKYSSSGTLQWQRNLSNSTWNGEGYFVSAVGAGLLYTGGYRRLSSGAGSMLAKVPQDGTKTGAYTVGSETFTYAAASNTSSTPSVALNNQSTSTFNGSLTMSTPAYAYTNLTNLAYATLI